VIHFVTRKLEAHSTVLEQQEKKIGNFEKTVQRLTQEVDIEVLIKAQLEAQSLNKDKQTLVADDEKLLAQRIYTVLCEDKLDNQTKYKDMIWNDSEAQRRFAHLQRWLILNMESRNNESLTLSATITDCSVLATFAMLIPEDSEEEPEVETKQQDRNRMTDSMGLNDDRLTCDLTELTLSYDRLTCDLTELTLSSAIFWLGQTLRQKVYNTAAKPTETVLLVELISSDQPAANVSVIGIVTQYHT
jgi:hypothetical protein